MKNDILVPTEYAFVVERKTESKDKSKKIAR